MKTKEEIEAAWQESGWAELFDDRTMRLIRELCRIRSENIDSTAQPNAPKTPS
jgi:hypothetical protein